MKLEKKNMFVISVIPKLVLIDIDLATREWQHMKIGRGQLCLIIRNKKYINII